MTSAYSLSCSRSFIRRDFIVPRGEEMEEHLHVAFGTPLWRRELESLLKCNFALTPQMPLSGFWNWVGKSVARLEGHTWLPCRCCTNLPVKLRQPLVALGRAISGDILAAQRDQGFCVDEPTIPLGFVWGFHLAECAVWRCGEFPAVLHGLFVQGWCPRTYASGAGLSRGLQCSLV